jgi:hypothetical protein
MGEVMFMSEPTSVGDELDRANRAYWLSVDIEARLEHVEPLQTDESFEISDLGDDEWADFVTTVRG